MMSCMNPNTRVVLYTDDPDEGGVAVYTHALACGLARMGYQVSCVQSEAKNALVETRALLGVRHHWLPFNTRKDFWRTMTKEADAEEALTATKPDVVVFANCDPFSHIAAKTVAVRRNIPFVVVENYVWSYESLPEKLVEFLPAIANHYRHSKEVVAVSEDNLNLLRRGFQLPAEKGQVIHYGRPDNFFTPPSRQVRERLRRESNIPPDAVLFLTVGRLETVKGHHLLVEALRKLAKTPAWANCYFAWLGTGALEQKLMANLKEFGLADHVKMLGRRWDVPDWLDASDIFVLPSLCEGMPLSIMEAMAKGLPVLATAVSGTPEELGDTGKLLPSPCVDSEATVAELATTLERWAGDGQLRATVGAACNERASKMFREQRMLDETRQVIDRALLPAGDYVSPGFAIVRADPFFPNMAVGDRGKCTWAYLRREAPHNWYVDKRVPEIGFVSRDEAHILFNTALRFRGKRCLEIGCWLGWSACHLALGGVLVDAIDPVLGNPDYLRSVRASLQAAGVANHVNLLAGASPHAVENFGWDHGRKWSLFFIDGNHDGAAPIADAGVCAQFAEPDALILFHDLASPDAARGLEYLRYRGWNTMIYSTMQIMGVAWRGAVAPVQHLPDPQLTLPIPEHLRNSPVSGNGEVPQKD
jgi:glycosyltransferase involved in cell wall biosynthesis/predicted O-methyltransferase YrrM